MIRTAMVSAASAAFVCTMVGAPTAAADPTAYMFGACWDPSQPVAEKPATIVYGCDNSSVMQNMTWSSWGVDGAYGTGIDNAVECQPNCAEGKRLNNPIVVHAWNPEPADKPGCPAGVQFYTDFTVAYPEGVPPWVKPGTSWSADVDYINLNGLPAVHFKNQEPYSCTALPS